MKLATGIDDSFAQNCTLYYYFQHNLADSPLESSNIWSRIENSNETKNRPEVLCGNITSPLTYPVNYCSH